MHLFVASAAVPVGGFAQPSSNLEFTTPTRRHVGVSGAIAQGKSAFPYVIAVGNPESRPPTASGGRISLQVKFPARPRLFPGNSFLPSIHHATINDGFSGVKTPGPAFNSSDPCIYGHASGAQCPPRAPFPANNQAVPSFLIHPPAIENRHGFMSGEGPAIFKSARCHVPAGTTNPSRPPSAFGQIVSSPAGICSAGMHDAISITPRRRRRRRAL